MNAKSNRDSISCPNPRIVKGVVSSYAIVNVVGLGYVLMNEVSKLILTQPLALTLG